MNRSEEIRSGVCCIGIEFGSTRIKAVLTGTDSVPLAAGVFDWSNHLENGIWTYSLDEVRNGLQTCFADLVSNVNKEYCVRLTSAAAIGISAMMHGYLAFDEDGSLLVPFRTWRNSVTGEAARRLTEAFSFNVPERWSIAHLYQAILNQEPHIGKIAFLTTLAGYVHWLLTGKKVLGIGDASGMFPIDPKTGTYDSAMMQKFEEMAAGSGLPARLCGLLPEIVPAGEQAGCLTKEGALLLDPSGSFCAGIPFCPPEGDAQTGMTATNSITPKTGNVSAGTSIFAMTVLEDSLKAVHREIDIVMTPCGDPVAMVHCNNCSSDFDAWVGLFGGLLREAGAEMPKAKLYDLLYSLAVTGSPDCDGVLNYNYIAGEQITELPAGKPMLFRNPDSVFSISNLMRSLVYSCMATLKIGMDILTGQEQVKLERIYAHGGLFKTPVASQPFLAAALGTDVTLMRSAGEGGAWGIALLASYTVRADRSMTLPQYLSQKVFAGLQGETVSPKQEDIDGFNTFMQAYLQGLSAERAAVLPS